jgi:hypothetical protein
MTIEAKRNSPDPVDQNVNKLSTKAMLRMDIPPKPDASGNAWLPEFVFPTLRQSVSKLAVFS